MPPTLIALLAAALVFITCGAVSASDAWQSLSDDEILDYYEQIAFGAEVSTPAYEQAVGEHIRKRREGETVQVLLLPQPSVSLVDPALAEAKAIVEELVARSGGIAAHVMSMDELIALSQGSREAQSATVGKALMVYLGNREEIILALNKASANPTVSTLLQSGVLKDAAAPLCFAVTGSEQTSPTTIGVTFVTIEMGSALRECLYEEIMQSFGLGRDFPDGIPSLFSDDRLYRVPTTLDWVLWRLHTDPSLVSGMDVATARAKGIKILQGLRTDRATEYPTP